MSCRLAAHSKLRNIRIGSESKGICTTRYTCIYKDKGIALSFIMSLGLNDLRSDPVKYVFNSIENS